MKFKTTLATFTLLATLGLASTANANNGQGESDTRGYHDPDYLLLDPVAETAQFFRESRIGVANGTIFTDATSRARPIDSLGQTGEIIRFVRDDAFRYGYIPSP